jgi:hypothetical protein
MGENEQLSLWLDDLRERYRALREQQKRGPVTDQWWREMNAVIREWWQNQPH